MKTLTTTFSFFIALLSFSIASAQSICTKANQVAITITQEDGQTVLNWNTIKEVNSSYFLVEKSADSIHYTAVNMVQAAGNSNFARHYTYSEIDTLGTTVYYRVTLVTMNGEQIASLPAHTFSSDHIASK